MAILPLILCRFAANPPNERAHSKSSPLCRARARRVCSPSHRLLLSSLAILRSLVGRSISRAASLLRCRLHPSHVRTINRACKVGDRAELNHPRRKNMGLFFPISVVHINPLLLGLLGLVIGILGGFFGVGGSFLSGPSLFSLGMPYNFVVGTDLIHIVGKSIVAARQHRILGHIDLKLAAVMVIGTLVGSEAGVDAIEALKRSGEVNLVVGLTAISVFTVISIFGAWESWQALRKSRATTDDPGGPKADVLVFDRLAKFFQGLALAPRISLRQSGILKISIWSIVLVSFVGGFFGGFLGGGAG